jgi:hypothetical protein
LFSVLLFEMASTMERISETRRRLSEVASRMTAALLLTGDNFFLPQGRITVLSRNIIPIVVGSVLGGLALLVGGAAAIMAFMPLAAASGTAIASAAGASATTGGATGGAASGGATSAVGRLGCGVCACCAVLCTPLALASARLNERWRRFSVGFRASVFLGLVCFLIAFAGFARNR